MRRAIALSAALLCLSGPALAQDEDEEAVADEELGDEPTDEAARDAENAADEAVDDAEQGASQGVPAAPREWWFGPYLRLNWVPLEFFFGFVFDEAPTAFNPGFGAMATYRPADGPAFRMGIGYMSYSAEGPFRNNGDPDIDTEWVESDLGLIHLTGSMLWHSQFSEIIGLDYGFGLDLGIVTGELVRTEARKDANGNYSKCPGPQAFDQFCAPGNAAYDEDGEHYNVVDERVPPIAAAPMLPQLALRVTPIPELALSAELAFGIVQFWLGFSAEYAPEL